MVDKETWAKAAKAKGSRRALSLWTFPQQCCSRRELEGWMISVGWERQDLAADVAKRCSKASFLWVCLSKQWSEKAVHDG